MPTKAGSVKTFQQQKLKVCTEPVEAILSHVGNKLALAHNLYDATQSFTGRAAQYLIAAAQSTLNTRTQKTLYEHTQTVKTVHMHTENHVLYIYLYTTRGAQQAIRNFYAQTHASTYTCSHIGTYVVTEKKQTTQKK